MPIVRRAPQDRAFAPTFVTDLAEDCGSTAWWRGFGVMLALIALALGLWPGLSPLGAATAMRLDTAARARFVEARIMPRAFAGAAPRISPGPAVSFLAFAPERPRIDLTTTLSAGSTLAAALGRAGVGASDAARAADLIAASVTPSDIAPGTSLAITLGPRAAPGQPRMLERLSLRARFDLALAIDRRDGALSLTRQPLAVDATPLRIRGVVGAGSSVYLAALAAGAPGKAIAQFLQTIDAHLSLDDIHPGDTFDLIAANKRARGGASEPGDLLYAGLETGGHPRAALMRWGTAGQFLEASTLQGSTAGQPPASTGFIMPVAGHITSSYGMRFHPILGYTRMHAGVDLAAPYGSPIYAVAAGTVSYAGMHGGHGNYVRLEHGGSLGSGYAHMSRIAVVPGQMVSAGQVIGYVGMSGLATGPHLHYEVYQGGRTVDPMTLHFGAAATLDPKDAAVFKAKLAALLLVKPAS